MSTAFQGDLFQSNAFQILGGVTTGYTITCDTGSYIITGGDAQILWSGANVTSNNHPGVPRWRYVYNKNQFVRRVGKELVVYEFIEPEEVKTQTPLEKRVTVVKRGKPAVPVASVPVAQIKADSRQYPEQQQRIMRMFDQNQFDQVLQVYAKILIQLKQQDEEDVEMLLHAL
jgi:hypothetical protein